MKSNLKIGQLIFKNHFLPNEWTYDIQNIWLFCFLPWDNKNLVNITNYLHAYRQQYNVLSRCIMLFISLRKGIVILTWGYRLMYHNKSLTFFRSNNMHFNKISFMIWLNHITLECNSAQTARKNYKEDSQIRFMVYMTFT